MFSIHVLRVKCEPLVQADFLSEEADPIDIITKSFQHRPKTYVSRGSEWRIGNIGEVPDDGLSFAMGRILEVKSPQFDANSHDFLEEEAMRAPFAFGVFDKRLQACGVIRKAGVSQNSLEISRKLASLLNSAPFAKRSNMLIVVDPIQDPIKFLEFIRDSEAVTRFSFTVRRPNPQDVERLIQRPAEEFTQEVNGDSTKIEVHGDSLDKSVIEKLSKAVAAVGETANANVRQEGMTRTKRINLGGNPVVEEVEPTEGENILEAILTSARRAYSRVRNLSL